MNKCITPEPTQTISAPLSSSSQDEQLSSSVSTITMASPSPRQTRKRPLIEACEHNEDDKQSMSRPISTTSSSRKRQRSKKESTVRFASAPHQTHVVPRWTKDEATSSWYSKSDIFAFRRQESVDAAILRSLIQTATTIDTLPQETAVYRGLERLLSSQIACEISDRRKRCVMSVLVAQHRGLDMELIAQVSKNFTEKATAWALTLGSI